MLSDALKTMRKGFYFSRRIIYFLIVVFLISCVDLVFVSNEFRRANSFRGMLLPFAAFSIPPFILFISFVSGREVRKREMGDQ